MFSDIQQSVTYARRSDKDRPWLPGAPPIRRRRSISSVLNSYQEDGLPDLKIPVRKVKLTSETNEIWRTQKLDHYANPEKKTINDNARQGRQHLFHGCASKVDAALTQSMAYMGPSIRFSRPRGYFSSTPAVYWTNSLMFALAWCVFTKSGKWISHPSQLPDGLECLTYVSEVDISTLPTEAGTYIIPQPGCLSDEQNLVDVSGSCELDWGPNNQKWCASNMSQRDHPSRTSPPGAKKTDWSLIGSRIPRVSNYFDKTH